MNQQTKPGLELPTRAPMAVSEDRMDFNRTGSWRYMRPVYLEKLAPCRKDCPAGTDIPRAIALTARGDWEGAYRLIKEKNPLPAICGRVCYHPCEGHCTRKCLDQGVSVQSIERFVSEACLELGEPELTCPDRGRQVAVIGSGPAGLAAAYFLRRQGVTVRVIEAEEKPGGMLRTAIPPYRLPRHILDKEISKLEALGIEFQCGTRVGRDIAFDAVRREYDAVLIAAGAHHSRRLPVSVAPGANLISGLALLREVNRGERPACGKKVLVIGGGNTAIDTARVVLRLGAEPTIVYRRSRNEMPATSEEVRQAELEGVKLIFLASPSSVHKLGESVEVTFNRMRLGAPDESGRRRPTILPGSEFSLKADAVVQAIGETPDLSFVSELRLKEPDLFLAGDALTGPSMVIKAIASGKSAAHSVLEFLGIEAMRPSWGLPGVDFQPEMLNAAYFPSCEAVTPSELPVSNRTSNFDEVIQTLSRSEVFSEAGRCLSCGTCNECDTCWLFCPEGAVSRSRAGYEIDLTYCKGCGICVQECPRGVITLVQEDQ